MTTMTNILKTRSRRLRQGARRLSHGLAAALAATAATAATAARTVNDLPGGPAVNQLNLHPPVTGIAADQIWLHNFVMIVCTLIFVGVFGVMPTSSASRRAPRPRRRCGPSIRP